MAPLACRTVPHDMDLGGYRLKRGAAIWVPFGAMHTSKHNFTQPTEFKPERWLQSGNLHTAASASNTQLAAPTSGPRTEQAGPSLSGNTAALNKSMLPFSDGPRNCLGMSMAMVVVRTVLMVGVMLASLVGTSCNLRKSFLSSSC